MQVLDKLICDSQALGPVGHNCYSSSLSDSETPSPWSALNPRPQPPNPYVAEEATENCGVEEPDSHAAIPAVD